MTEIMTLTFEKWAKWNPRKDIKNPTWFAMSNRICEDDEIQTLSDSEFRAFVYLICIASQKNSPTISINFAKAERVSGIRKNIFLKTLEKLVTFGICTQSVRDPNASVQIANATLHYTTEQDTTEQNTTSCSVVLDTPEPKASSKQTYKIQTDQELKALFSQKTLQSWVALYCADYVERELTKAIVWLEANPKKNNKTKRGWVTFVAGWLDRGWPTYQAQQPANAVAQLAKPKGQFEALADRLVLATKQFPPGDEGIAAFMGHDWDWISRSRLMPSIRAMKADDPWAKKRLVDDLRGAHERAFASVSQKSG